jgi:predicted 3-demethylubiquinone-9 3-methyltransferase (glyoxalase superfamily)
MIAKNKLRLWYDKEAEEAARFYTATFPDRPVGSIEGASLDYPSGNKGDVLVIHFTVCGIPCFGMNGGPEAKHSIAFSFQIATDDQAETDRYWNAIIGNGGEAGKCGWCKGKWGISRQIMPRVLLDATTTGGEVAERAFAAMMTMGKNDVAAIEAAIRG